MDDLLRQHFVGRDGYTWWVGQVAPEETWKNNIPGQPEPNNSSTLGFSERYRVRIMGYHTDSTFDVADDELPWAYIMYPVTAGGGGRASYQSSNIAAGNFVIGFFIDGPNAQLPIIQGIIGNNDYQEVMKELNGDKRFVPVTGHQPGEKIPTTQVKATPGAGETATQENSSGPTTNRDYVESTTGNNTQTDFQSQESRKSGQRDKPLAETQECDPAQTGKFQQQLQNTLQDIQELQRSIYDTRTALSTETSDIQAEIDAKIDEASKLIAGTIKNGINEVEASIQRETNEKLKQSYNKVFPNEVPDVMKTTEKVVDAIACAFREQVNGTGGTVADMLGLASNRMVNADNCAAEIAMGILYGNAVGNASNSLGEGLGEIVGAVGDTADQALGAVGDVVGAVGDLTSAISDVTSGAKSFVKDPLSFLGCEEDPKCNTVTIYSLWNGSKTSGSPGISGVMDSMKNAVDSVTAADAAITTALPDDIESILNDTLGEFQNLFNNPNCDSGPNSAIECGPPTIKYLNTGGGSGASGNLIVSASGEILGYDPIDFGTGYSKNTTVYVHDECGTGSGGVIEPVIEDYIYTDDEGNEVKTKGVVDLIVLDPGADYISTPNGNKGGFGRVWKYSNETLITHPDKTFDPPIPPGYEVEVTPGDGVELPAGTEIITEPTSPDETTGESGGETIVGGATHIVQLPGIFTTPFPLDKPVGESYPSESDGAYPVLLYLCEVIIQESGVGYQTGDEVVIEPSYGATAVMEADNVGRVNKVKVTAGGEGFKEMPLIYVRSATGFNSVLSAKFCVKQVGKDEMFEPEIQDKVVTVVNCVGARPVGYVNGKPYYGPFHTHNGRKMVGAVHTSSPHDFIEDVPIVRTPLPEVELGDPQHPHQRQRQQHRLRHRLRHPLQLQSKLRSHHPLQHLPRAQHLLRVQLRALLHHQVQVQVQVHHQVVEEDMEVIDK